MQQDNGTERQWKAICSNHNFFISWMKENDGVWPGYERFDCRWILRMKHFCTYELRRQRKYDIQRKGWPGGRSWDGNIVLGACEGRHDFGRHMKVSTRGMENRMGFWRAWRHDVWDFLPSLATLTLTCTRHQTGIPHKCNRSKLRNSYYLIWTLDEIPN